MMLDLTFSQNIALGGSLMDVAFSQQKPYSGNLLDMAFSHANALSGNLLDISFSHGRARRTFRFDGNHAIGMGDFDVRVTIDGKPAPICDFTDTMTVGHGENEAYTCTFSLLPPKERKKPKLINPEKWYAKDIVVEIVSEAGSLKIYQGKVDKMGVNLLTGRFEISCSDRREQQINKLPRSTIEAVGITSKAAHGDSFETQADELEKRLQTVPASFEFDVNGTPYLTPWREKDTADMVITPCMIYQREPRVELAAVGGVLNEISYTVRLQGERLLQRGLHYSYDSGLNVCSYARYYNLAGVEEIAQAVAQTGWTLGNFNFERTEPSGWYRCNGVMTGWMRDYVEQAADEHGRPVSRKRVSDKAVKSGSFSIYKRWRQSVSETYTITLKNSGSIAQYEAGKEKLHFDVAHPDVKTDKWDEFEPHQGGLKYETSMLHFRSSPYLNLSPRHDKGLTFTVAPNGDRVAQTGLDDDARRTPDVAFWTAYTKMLASHRNNSAEFHIKFLPQIGLRQTHEIRHSHFSGRCKVSSFRHIVDFRHKRAFSDVQYRFFRNPLSPHQGALSEPEPLKRLTWQYPRYRKNYILQRVELPKDGEVGGAQGMVYRLAFVNHYGVPIYRPVVFRINTPPIEAQSSEAQEQTAASVREVAIYHSNVEIRV